MPDKIFSTIFKTKFGWAGLVADEKGLLRLILPCENKEVMEAQLKEFLKKEGNAAEGIEENREFQKRFNFLMKDLESYFQGKSEKFNYCLNLNKYSPFQCAVFACARTIPYGITRSYQWVARMVGSPRGFRAVGQALKTNPLPIIIPCHRVIEQRGRIGGFSFGITWKERLLKLEKIILA